MHAEFRSPLLAVAEVAALERRVSELETRMDGEPAARLKSSIMYQLYDWVLSLSRRTDITEHDAKLVAAAALTIDEANLIHMARQTMDAFPWVSILGIVRAARARHDLPELRTGEARLLDVVRSVLRIQGLGIVDPEDIVARGNAMQHAVRGFFGEEQDSNSPPPSNQEPATRSPKAKRARHSPRTAT